MRASRLALAGLLLAVPALVARAERVDAFVALGKSVKVTVTEPGDVATAAFLVQGTAKKVSVSVKPASKTSKIVPSVRLVAPDGTGYDAAAIAAAGGRYAAVPAAAPKSVTVTLPTVPGSKSGLWRVEVTGLNDSVGEATVLVKASDTTAATFANVVVPNGGTLIEDVSVGSGQTLTLTIKRGKGATIVPRVQILDPHGALVADGFLGAANKKTGLLSLKAYRLPVFGTYRLLVTGENGGGGTVSITAKTAPAKLSKTAPTASAGAPTEAEFSTEKSLDGTASAPRAGGALGFLWSQVAGPAVELEDPQTSTPTFTAPATRTTLGFEVAVVENGTWSAPVPVTVEVGARPIADAGRSRVVAAAAAVQLDGSGSTDLAGDGLSYAWRQLPVDGGPAVTLTGAGTATPSFTAPNVPGVLRFGLTVDDGSIRSFEDVVVVRVGDGSTATPDAGRDQFVQRMATVHLSALATQTPSGVLDSAVQWTQLSGPTVTLDNATSPFPAFTAPKVGADLLFQVTAGGASDQVWVHVRPAETNVAPISRGNGPQTVFSGSASLDASTSSDPDGDPLTRRWAQTRGPAVAPADPTAATTSVAVGGGNEARTYAVQAFDGLAYGAPDLVEVRNSGFTGAPRAAAGIDITVSATGAVQLDGRGSQLAGGAGPLTYRWRQVSAKDWFDVDVSLPAFDPTASTTTFSLPADLSSLASRRTMLFELIVNDGAQDSPPDYVNVTFQNLPRNGKPVVTASATTTNPIAGGTVQLLGTAIDRDGDPVTVRWTQTLGTPVTLVGGATTLSPSFVAPASGTLRFQIVGNDGFDNGDPATVTIVVDAAPTARMVINPSQAAPDVPFTIDARTSTDPEGQTLTYTLTKVSPSTYDPTPDSTPGLWNGTAPATSQTWRLVVNDGRQNSAAITGTLQVGQPVATTPTAARSSAPYGLNVALNANATGTITTYAWTQLKSGSFANDPTCTISGGNTATPNVKLPIPTTSTGYGGTQSNPPSATFQVTVSNSTNSATGTVKVTFFASFNDKLADGLQPGDKVYGVITGNGCTSCHTGSSSFCPVGSGSNASGFGMNSATSFRNNAVGVNACGSSKKRITANDSTQSWLIDRVKGTSSSQMGSLSAGQIAFIEDWINQGAQDN